MRTIKFRAYYKKHKTVYPVTALFDDGVVKILLNEFNQRPIYSSECDIMQFTGLLDKNGKEIYEGDLIKTSGDTKIQISDNKIVNSPYWRIAKIVFVEGCFKQIIISQENSYFGKLPSPPTGIFKSHVYYEVIGNIYENQELLEVKDE